MIDIIDLTQDPYRNLTATQMAIVREAQAQKDKIVATASEKKQKNFFNFLKHNIARNSILSAQELAIDEDAAREIAIVKEDLRYRLAYSSDQSEEGETYAYPDNPNYNLSPAQRFTVVRNYYMTKTTNPTQRLAFYEEDSLAQSYLGEYYATLYELLSSYC